MAGIPNFPGPDAKEPDHGGSTFFIEERSERGGISSMEENVLPPGGRAFLDLLIRYQLLSPGSVNEFLSQTPSPLHSYTDGEVLGGDLVKQNHLTGYQLSRVLSGKTHGLVLGNHRILDRL